MTYKKAREYLIPIAANCVLPQYAAALEKAMEALEEVERYRATGLEPEDIRELIDEEVFEVASLLRRMIESGQAEWLCDLVKANEEGRVVVLPCNDEAILCRDGVEFKADHWNHHLTAFADDMSARYGKRVVLFSIEEAEAALKGEYHG